MARISKKYNCQDCQFKLECFQKLSPEELELIDSNRVELLYKKGEIISKQGAFASNILHVSEGFAKIYIEHNNKNLILKVVSSKDLIGLPSIFNNNVFHYSVAALTDVMTCSINTSILVNLIRENNVFAENIISLINKNMVQYFDRFISLTQKQSHGRIADAILHLSNDVFYTDEFEMPITRKDLAELTGMSTENVIRILKELNNDRILSIDNKKIKIVSPELLQKLSEFG
jgi:CRP/FNR family transcriptional regulator, polysaccharide utilization system transcription regulator